MEIKTIKTPLLLSVLVLGGIFAAPGDNQSTNQLWIGDEKVPAKTVDGRLVGERWMVVSNTLWLISTEVTPIKAPTGVKSHYEPALHLVLYTGHGGSGKLDNVKGLHGLVYMAKDWRKPELPQTNEVDVLSTEDNTRIVVMVLGNGPIYSSTNSGMTWKMFDVPGHYKFPLTLNKNGAGFVAEATIHPSPTNQPVLNSPPLASNWYAVATAPDGSKMVMTEDASQSAPVLNITHSSNDVMISWPATFTGFVLQENSDLSSTNWVDVTNAVNKTTEEFQVFISSPPENDFYRLKSQ